MPTIKPMGALQRILNPNTFMISYLQMIQMLKKSLMI